MSPRIPPPEAAWYALGRALLADRALVWEAPHRLYLITLSENGNLAHRTLAPPDPEQDIEDILRELVAVTTLGRIKGFLKVLDDLVGVAIICEGWLPPEDEISITRKRAAVGGSIPPLQEHPGRRETRFALLYTSEGNCYQYAQLRGNESTVTESPLDIVHTSTLGEGMDTLMFALSPHPI